MIHNSWGKKKKVKQCESFANPTSCWKKKSIFFKLKYWNLYPTQLGCHAYREECLRESIIGTVLNISGKTKDGVKSRLDLLEMGLRPGLAPMFGLK